MAYPALTSTQDFATLSASHSENSGPLSQSHLPTVVRLHYTTPKPECFHHKTSQVRLAVKDSGSQNCPCPLLALWLARNTVTCFPSHGKAHFAHLIKGLTNSPSLNNHLACQPFFQVKLTFHEKKQLADTAVPGTTSCFGLRHENPPGPPQLTTENT